MLKNGLYNIIGGLSRTGISLITIPVLISSIGLEEYGLWSLVFAVIGIIAIIENGLSVSTTVFLSRDLALNDSDAIAQVLTVGTVLTTVISTLVALPFLLWSSLLMHLFPNFTMDQQAVATHALQISGFIVWIKLIQQVPVGVVQAYQYYGVINVINTIQTLVSNLGLVFIAWLGGRTIEMITWYGMISFVTLGVFLWFTHSIVRPLHLQPQWNQSKGIDIIKYTTTAWITMIGSALFSHMDRIIIGAILGVQAVGVYAAITNITVQINNLSAMPVQPLLPVLSRLAGDLQTHLPHIHEKVKQALQVNIMISLGMSAILFISGSTTYKLVGIKAIPIEQILSFQLAVLIYGIYSLNAVGYFILLGVKSVKLCMILVAASGITSLFLIYLGTKTYGLVGSVLGNGGYIFSLFLNIVAFRKLHLSFKIILKWIRFPVLWFVWIVILHIILRDHVYVQIGIILFFVSVLIWWFVNEQNINIHGLARKLNHQEL